MGHRKPSSLLPYIVTIVGLLLVLGGVFWLLGESKSQSTVAAPDSRPAPSGVAAAEAVSDSVTAISLFNTDLGSGSTEFSAVTLNEATNRLMIADDEDRLFEYDLAANGDPIAPPRRTIRVQAGAGDIEGIAWMSGTTYVLSHENDGALTVVDLDDDATLISAEQVVRTIQTGIAEIDGNGIEGVAYVGWFDNDAVDPTTEFVVVDERPPAMYWIDRTGTVSEPLELAIGIADVSDVWVGEDGTYSVISDESGVVVDFVIDGAGDVQVVETLDLDINNGRFEQPEGITRSRDLGRLYVVGEAPGPGRFSLGAWVSN